MREPKIVAEIGCNHMGDMSIAKEMINVAKTFCKVDMVSFKNETQRSRLLKKSLILLTQSHFIPMVKPMVNIEKILNLV